MKSDAAKHDPFPGFTDGLDRAAAKKCVCGYRRFYPWRCKCPR